MTSTVPSSSPSLARLASTQAGASRVFHRHGLDYCCHGQATLAESCAAKGLDPAAVLAEIEAESHGAPPVADWASRPLGDLIDHVLTRFHEGHRAELPRLLEMARKVESVHADRPDVPKGLAAHLAHVHQSLLEHMEKEEQVLFPMLRAGRGRMASMPIQMMEMEHDDHGSNLAKLRELGQDYTPPMGACATWRALYLGLDELEAEVMQHIHLENHVLFPRALRG
ncbi:MAG: iron-sulfur cluster repair protein YtfE [Planctomycetes bacterium]|nr:iron-sulfur cluster repair protein YtfE [Planctomycetota bacterium]